MDFVGLETWQVDALSCKPLMHAVLPAARVLDRCQGQAQSTNDWGPPRRPVPAHRSPSNRMRKHPWQLRGNCG